MKQRRELLCRRFAVHAGSYPRRSLAQCESGSYGAELDGHATGTMETIAEDAESEYELGNCVDVCTVLAAGHDKGPCIVLATGHDTVPRIVLAAGHDTASRIVGDRSRYGHSHCVGGRSR
jgi:hypothetical protein